MERVVLGTREIVEYRGKCPDCGSVQVSKFREEDVDIPCWNCSEKRKEAKKREEYKALIGGSIIDIIGHEEVETIIIKGSDGKEYIVKPRREFGENAYLCIDKKTWNFECER